MRLVYTLTILFLYIVAQAQSSADLKQMEVLYECIQNRVFIDTDTFPPADWDVEVSHGHIQKSNDATTGYIWTITQLDTSIVTLKIVHKHNHLVGYQRQYWLRPIPAPIPVLAKSKVGIGLVIKNFKHEIEPLQLIGFEVIYYSVQSGTHRVLYNQGARFRPDIVNLIYGSVPGDRFVFNKFKYTTCGNQYRFVPDPLIYHIK